jgi:hypothetical protein
MSPAGSGIRSRAFVLVRSSASPITCDRRTSSTPSFHKMFGVSPSIEVDEARTDYSSSSSATAVLIFGTSTSPWATTPSFGATSDKAEVRDRRFGLGSSASGRLPNPGTARKLDNPRSE